MKKAVLYSAYWASYLVIFSLIEGLPAHALFIAFYSELVILPIKVIFVLLVVEKLTGNLFMDKRFIRFSAVYLLLLVVCAFLMRLADNEVILKYLLTQWKKEPLLSAAPFLYNAIKLQFLVTIPFAVKLFHFKAPAAVEEHPQFIRLKCDRRMVNIPLADILYGEAQGNYTRIYTEAAIYKTYLTISELEEQLPASLFVRVHRSFIISAAHVQSFTNAYYVVRDKQIPIGRSYRLKKGAGLAMPNECSNPASSYRKPLSPKSV